MALQLFNPTLKYRSHYFSGIHHLLRLRRNSINTMRTWNVLISEEDQNQCVANQTRRDTPGCLKTRTPPGWRDPGSFDYYYIIRPGISCWILMYAGPFWICMLIVLLYLKGPTIPLTKRAGFIVFYFEFSDRFVLKTSSIKGQDHLRGNRI